MAEEPKWNCPSLMLPIGMLRKAQPEPVAWLDGLTRMVAAATELASAIHSAPAALNFLLQCA